MGSIFDILDVIIPAKLSLWLLSRSSFKKTYRKETLLAHDVFKTKLKRYTNLSEICSNEINANNPNYILVITAPDAPELVKGQIIGLNEVFRSVFIISDISINRLQFSENGNGDYKVILRK